MREVGIGDEGWGVPYFGALALGSLYGGPIIFIIPKTEPPQGRSSITMLWRNYVQPSCTLPSCGWLLGSLIVGIVQDLHVHCCRSCSNSKG